MKRLDLYLYEKGFVKSRKKAQDLIKSSCVFVNGNVIDKPSYDVSDEDNMTIDIIDNCPYVSRGGLKLEKVLNDNNFDLIGKVALDIGSSTGGFTDCLLQYGTSKVYAVDSGSNQLDKKLIEDKRVVSFENYNARNIKYDDFKVKFDYITIDVSFISQTYIIPNFNNISNESTIVISLIKPQFETTKDKLSKGGILKDVKSRLVSVNRVIDCYEENGFYIQYFVISPIKGGDGNIEYLACFSRQNKNEKINEDYIKKIVRGE